MNKINFEKNNIIKNMFIYSKFYFINDIFEEYLDKFYSSSKFNSSLLSNNPFSPPV